MHQMYTFTCFENCCCFPCFSPFPGVLPEKWAAQELCFNTMGPADVLNAVHLVDEVVWGWNPTTKNLQGTREIWWNLVIEEFAMGKWMKWPIYELVYEIYDDLPTQKADSPYIK